MSLKATNAAGTDTKVLRLTVSPPGELLVGVNGAGSVTGGYLGLTQRVQGKKYTVTAKPAPGFVFSGFTGDLTGAAPSLTFTMPERLVLTANFIPSPFLAVTGSYFGLLTKPGGAGSATFTVTSSGSFTLACKIDGKPFTFVGVLALDGSFSGSTGKPPATAAVQLQLDLTGVNGLTGTLTTGGITYMLQAYQRGFDTRTNPATQYEGRSTVVLAPVSTDAKVPQGIGSGSVVVDAAGFLKFTGVLGDGTKVSQGVAISKDGLWPLFLSAYANKGSVAGVVTLSETPGPNDLQGTLIWNKPPTTAAPYADAFTSDVTLAGRRYTKPAEGQPVLVLPNNGAAIANIGALSQPFTFPLAGRATKLSITGANNLRLTVTLTDGLFTGTYQPTPPTKALSFQGALLQGSERGRGFVRLPDGKTAPVEVVAAP